jgi:hypothetical protein
MTTGLVWISKEEEAQAFCFLNPDLEINNTQLHGASTAFMDEVADYLVLINTEWHTDIKQFVDFLMKFILRASTWPALLKG